MDKLKRVLLGISIAILILTILTFFTTGIGSQYKLILALFILINGALLLITTRLLIKQHYPLLISISILLLILGILPLLVGLNLLSPAITLKVPLLLYQALTILSAGFYLYLLLRKTNNPAPKFI